jgi:ABC-type phosphate transport system substrate-binding protein
MKKEWDMRRKLFLSVIFLVVVGMNFSFPVIASADDLIVIGNRSVPVSTLTSREIKMVYLGKMKVWSNGLKVVCARLEDKKTSKRFLKHYVKKNPRMFKKFWKKQIFTGGGKPPKKFKREKDLVKYVSETKGAVGYISSQSYTDSVKMLSVLH